MRNKIHQQVYLYCCLGIAFMLPVWGKLVPTLIVILILNWLLSGDYIRTIPVLFRDVNRRKILSFATLYVLYLIGLLYTSNFQYAGFDLEVKLSLIIFPLIFSTADLGFLSPRHLRIMMQVYIAGCVAGSLLLFGHAIALWWDGVPGAFYYMKLSWYFHSAYFAMYLNFAIAFIIIELLSRSSSRLSSPSSSRPSLTFFLTHFLTYLIILAWFFIFIFLLSSKMGLICMVLIAMLASAELILKQKKVFLGLGIIIIFLMCVRAGIHIFSGTSARIIQSTETLGGAAPETSKSTSDRIAIWKISLEIIKSHPLFGVGTGDVKDELVAKYKEENVEEALELKLNAHNQYLQTFVTLGIPGLLALLLMLVLPMFTAFRSKHYLYFVFILLFALNIAVESMFETQAGVVWYAFFNVVLFAANHES